jgi:hypothetical protein
MNDGRVKYDCGTRSQQERISSTRNSAVIFPDRRSEYRLPPAILVVLG